MRASARDRLQKVATLHIPLRKKLSQHLTEKYVVDNSLAHKSTQVLMQRNLLKKYDKQIKKGFTDPLKYGNTEFIDTHASMYHSIEDKPNRTFSKRAQSAGSSRRRAATSGTFGGLISAKDMIEEQYWDVAEQVLADTRSWCELPTQMSKYFARCISFVIILSI